MSQALSSDQPRAPYRTDLRAQAARGAFYGVEHFDDLFNEIARRCGGRGMSLSEALAAVDAMPARTFQRLVKWVPADWWEAV